MAAVDVAIVKGKTPAGDRICLAFGDGSSCRAAARVIHDLPHLVVESVFGIDDGRWGRLATRRDRPAGVAVDAVAAGPMLDRDQPGQLVARAAADAVVNLWWQGPDTPAGVRDRLLARAKGESGLAARIEDLAARLDDEAIRGARAGVQYLYRGWRALPGGGTLRLTWPLLAGPEPDRATRGPELASLVT